ncbi:acetoacetate--CoA ligase [Crenobacter sp. SG2303]|uniref:Acetoacetate--CoA ligase n=1 Tax=Crenobacter oryzisoli TaxID=3056844 RepID=A0ABT7XRE8_9NEIS|nr:acetoacetate--CoA ligase [Crenobacter sp. SG2303]MDN0076369.1 acetoacetate--CoA ligase [Crenobacter sp. SG2303]
MSDTPLWQPPPARVAGTHLTAFTRLAESAFGHPFPDYHSLWQASVDTPETFWALLWNYAGVIGERGETVLTDGADLLRARFFPDARLNYAENLLRRSDDGLAVVFWGESKVKHEWSHRELAERVSRLQQALAATGVKSGDRVAGFMPNLPETLAAMLAATSLGAVWTSCSPDFGIDGALDRFGQTEPTVLFCPDGYWYNGKDIDIADKLAAINAGLPSLKKTVVVPYMGRADAIAARLTDGVTLDAFVAPYQPQPLRFEQVPFRHPLFILYSSGTTGKPKCIVHGHGGTLLQHLKEHQLHADLHRGDALFYFTTCGWMMWNWLVSGLASGATLLLYDGSPFAADGRILWDYADAYHCTHFGTSAKYIDGLHKLGLEPGREWPLIHLRAVLSTGSPLVAESFEWAYRSIKADMDLASISGGTDIVSCFVLGNANLPVWAGELQCRGLGMAVDVWNESGQPVRGEKGELVCTKPFPSMPVGFWRDADGEKYRKAYFDRFPNVWCHGDFAEITEHDGLIIHGRSDAVLNPGGVRIGTAEIYRQVEAFDEIIEALAVGQHWQDDERVVLFVRLRDGVKLDEALEKRIKDKIRHGASPRHVPARIVQVTDIPRTLSGKVVELAVRNVIHGEPVSNVSSLANPEALKQFADRPELKS